MNTGNATRLCSISWVENLSHFASATSSFQPSCLNAHLVLPQITAAFQRQTEHLEILLAKSLPSPQWVEPGGCRSFLAQPPSRVPLRHSYLQVQAPPAWGSWITSSSPCSPLGSRPAAGLWIDAGLTAPGASLR